MSERILVPGSGPVPCDLMFIGEAPGRDEEREGKPFVGKAGQLLWELAGNVGIARKDVRVDNVVQFRPTDERGNNRAPTEEEIEANKITFWQSIDKAVPKIIVALGKTAQKALDISRVGVIEPMQYGGFIIPRLATYHPAYLLPHRRPDLRAEFQAHLRKALDELQYAGKPPWERYDYVLISLMESEEHIVFSGKAEYIIYDIETTGLDPIKDSVIGIGIEHQGGLGYVPDPQITTRLPLPKERVCHNAAFEDRWLPFEATYDTMLACHVLMPDRGRAGYSLKQLAREFTPYGGYEKPVLDYFAERGWSVEEGMSRLAECPIELVAQYCCGDVAATKALYEKTKRALQRRGLLDHFRDVVMPAARFTRKIEGAGIGLSKARLEAKYDEINKQIEKAEKDLQSFDCVETWVYSEPKGGLFFCNQCKTPFKTERHIHPVVSIEEANLFNPNSTDHIAAVCDILGLQSPEKTKGGKPRMAEHCLVEMLSQDDSGFIEAILDYRRLCGRRDKFLKAWLKRVNADKNRLYQSIYMTGTGTFRLSAGNRKLDGEKRAKGLGPHQCPEDLRDLFAVPEGKVFVEIDWSQIELRVLAVYAYKLCGDRTLLDIFREGRDPHSELGKRIYEDLLGGEYVDARDRTPTKMTVYGSVYCIGPGKLRQQLLKKSRVDLPYEQCRQVIDGLMAVWPGLRAYRQWTERQLTENNGKLRTLYGVPVYAKSVTEACNRPIQGTAAITMLRAKAALEKKGLLDWDKNTCVKTHHDSLAFELDASDKKSLTRLIDELLLTMQDAETLAPFFAEHDLALEVDCKCGKSWGELKPYNHESP